MSNCVGSSRYGLPAAVNRPPSPPSMLLSRHIRRREFIALLGGSAATWPLTVRGQQSPSFLRVGAGGVQPRTTAVFVAFVERMAELGYEEGKNFSFEYVQAANVAGYEAAYHELASRNVDILLAGGSEI